jgi:MFS family permease
MRGGKIEPMPTTPIEADVHKHLRYNILVNLLDGAYFGLGMGFGSFTTIVTLFVTRLTSSAILIGLIPAIHAAGWQLPQLFTAGWVSRQRRYKPMVVWLTTQERIPFLGLAAIAWFLPALGNRAALVLTFAMLVWQGMGAGITANAWQSMVAKIIPPESRGSFFGAQAALANIMMSVGAVLAGYLLDRVNFSFNFAACFLLTVFFMGLSLLVVALTREPEDREKIITQEKHGFWRTSAEILRHDRNFDWFLVVRIMSFFATMGFSFYIVYVLRQFHIAMVTAGFLTATLAIASTAANAIMGWTGDRLGHRSMLVVGAGALSLSALIAWAAPSFGWFYLVVALAGFANASIWTTGMAMTVEFGTEEQRPIYIGLSNTLTAPAAIVGPLIGGWIADTAGFHATFITSAALGAATVLILLTFLRDPRLVRQGTE